MGKPATDVAGDGFFTLRKECLCLFQSHISSAPISSRSRLPVINSLWFKDVTNFPENEVRVLRLTPRGMIPKRVVARGVNAISEVKYQFQTGITQPDRSSRQWI